MAYFNNSFQKLFVGTKNQASVAGVSMEVDNGFLNVAGVQSVKLSETRAPYSLGVGTFGLFTADTYLSVVDATNYTKPLILASSALYQKDKVSPYIGGYQESTKSKLINPKYVSRFYRVDPCLPVQNVVHVGTTPFTDTSPATSGCQKDFICNKTYYLRLDIKGSPALRFLNHNIYWTADYFTGCCPGAGCESPAPCTVVDPTLVYIGWADQFVLAVPNDPINIPVGDKGVRNNQVTGPFIQIVVFDTNGIAWYQPGTNNGIQEWDQYVTSSSTNYTGTAAGMKITGAYVGTVFGDCTFYPTDFFEKEPVKIIASETDWNGNPCETNLCVVEQCCPRQGMGFGDTVLKDLILSESYLQNAFYTGKDLRIREITQGYDISSAINRAAQYYRYFILHSVPRFNNPTGVFDNDQYMLEIITSGVSSSFETTFTNWLEACPGSGCAVELEQNECSAPCIDCETSPPLTISGDTTPSVGSTTYTASNETLGTATFSIVGFIPEGVTLTNSTVGTATLVITSDTPASSHITLIATDANGCTATLNVVTT